MRPIHALAAQAPDRAHERAARPCGPGRTAPSPEASRGETQRTDTRLTLKRMAPALIALVLAWSLAAQIAAAQTNPQVSSGPTDAERQLHQQELVDRATLAAQDMVNPVDGTQAQSVLKQARAVMVCPQIFKAGFLFGGSGGGCVLLARDGNGSWSSPAFYSIGSASFGFQAGIQDAEVMMMIMNQHALDAVLDNQFKFGADASVALITVGGGIQGATTAALRADIVAFARTRGLFAGISLEGSLLGADSAGDRAYYGQDIGSRDLVISMRASNPGADPLRAVLMRYGTQGPAPMAAASPSPGFPPVASDAPGGSYGAPTPLAPVRSQKLPAPR